MNILLYGSGAVSGIAAWAVFSMSKGAIHEIEALMFVLIGVVCVAGAAVIGAIERSHKPPEVVK